VLALAALLGAGVGGGLLIVIIGIRGPATRTSDEPRWRGLLAQWGLSATAVIAASSVGLVIAVVTGWPVAGLLCATAALTLPRTLGPDRAHAASVERIEAVAAWAEDLAGTMRAARGVEQAIMQTAQAAPTVLGPHLRALTQALQSGARLPDALAAFAADLADPTVDLIVSVLLFSATRQARDIAGSLASVATVARRQASARMRIAASRARSRTAARIVTAVVLTVTVGVSVLAGDFLRPYAGPVGQLMLAAIGAGYGACLWWMHRLARIPDLPRILTGGAR
jgi:Flp pilus assembly protein TadB